MRGYAGCCRRSYAQEGRQSQVPYSCASFSLLRATRTTTDELLCPPFPLPPSLPSLASSLSLPFNYTLLKHLSQHLPYLLHRHLTRRRSFATQASSDEDSDSDKAASSSDDDSSESESEDEVPVVAASASKGKKVEKPLKKKAKKD